MKVYTNKFNDTFYLPVTNDSCRTEHAYLVTVNDTYGLLSIENTVGIGPINNVYITAPKVPSVSIPQGTLYARRNQSGSYYLEVTSPNSSFNVYPNGKTFYVFYSDGQYANIKVEFNGYNGQFPTFIIDVDSLQKLLAGASLPTVSSPTLINRSHFISTEFETRNFLKVSSATSVKGQQTASVILRQTQGAQQTTVYDFVIDPTDSPVKTLDQTPIGLKETHTVQLSRSFVPVSSVVTLQLDSSGDLYMDKLYSGSAGSQISYRRRCTNLGFEQDLARFCASVPKPSLYEFEEQDFETSTPNLSDQYLTDVNCGVTINKETQEGFRMFAPLWMKDRIPSYFAIFRKNAINESKDLLDGASLVKLVDIHKTQLGPYLQKLKDNENFSKAPLEVSIDQGYSLRWNGVSVDTGYWITHTEFIGIDIQEGLSDYEFNEILSGGFSRGSIVSPQFLNIEFLFDDNEAKLYDVNQYFGLYCDEVDLSKFIPNVVSTETLFSQNQTRPSSNADFNSSVISNPDGVKIVVDLNETPDRSFSVIDPTSMIVNSEKVSSRYKVSIVPTTKTSRLLKLEFSSDSDVSSKFSSGKQVRLEDQYSNFVSYVTVKTSSYDSIKKKMLVTFEENDSYSQLRLEYWINVFDFSPDPSPSIKGRIRFDSEDTSKSRCAVFSKQDLLGDEVQQWIDSVVDIDSSFRDSLVVFDKSSSAYAILLANSVSSYDDYIKVFFDVLESNGSIVQGDDVFINVSEYDVDGAIPGPKVINSPTRKFIVKSKQNSYSVKNFEFSNYKNQVVGLLTFDSKNFNLGSIIGTDAQLSIPVREATSPYTGVGIKLPSSSDAMSYGDGITVEQTIGDFRKRWSIIRSNQPTPQVTKTSGAVTEISIVSNTFYSDSKYTQLEIQSDDYFPVRSDYFELIDGSASQKNIKLNFVTAESKDNGNYILTFSNKDIKPGYQAIKVTSPETEVTYFDYGPYDSLSTIVARSFQRFVDCPMNSVVSNETVYLYSESGATNLSVGIYAPYGTINQSEINGQFLKPWSIIKDETNLRADYYVYQLEDLLNSKLYSTEEDFLSKITDDTKILSKSGAPSTATLWNNRSYGVPDIRSIVDGENRVLVKFNKDNQPSLLNERLQLINSNKLNLSMLSFYDFVDLDFFQEIPARIGTQESTVSFQPLVSIFSQKVSSPNTIASSTPAPNIKELKLSVNIAENIYANWEKWDPLVFPDFLAFNKRRLFGCPRPDLVDSLPTSWNPSYGFSISYLNPNDQWVPYNLTFPSVVMETPVVSNYRVSTINDPMWEILFVDPSTSNSIPSFYDVQAVLNGLILGMYSSPADPTRTKIFLEIKRLVSYCFKQLVKNNIDASKGDAFYNYNMVLPIDDEHRDYRFDSTFVQGTYSVEENSLDPVGASGDRDENIAGVPKENIVSNFATSLFSTQSIKTSSGRWKRVMTSNVDMQPYLINVDPLLLPYDMFVNATEPDVSSNSFSLDWYLISGWPKFERLDELETNYQYIGRRINIDLLKSTQHDYFSDYFTVGSGQEQFLNGKKREKMFLWSTIHGNEQGYTTTFKGLNIQFSSPKLNLNGTKFAAVLQVENSIDTPTKISLIFNKTWNALTLLVQINIDSYYIDGSISLKELYQLKNNVAKTDSSALYGPMLVHGASTLSFNKVNRAYNTEETIIVNEPLQLDDYYEFNQYEYQKAIKIKYDDTSQDIELFGVRYFPNVDYLIKGTILFGTKNETTIDLMIPRSRVRGVFDPQIGMERAYIDGLYLDDFFAIVADIDGSPTTTYVTFVSENLIKINGVVSVINSYYPTGSQVLLSNVDSSISNAKVYAIGEWPAYEETVKQASVSTVLSKLESSNFEDILVSLDSSISKTNITASYVKPPVIRPSMTKNVTIDEFGDIKLVKKENAINLFRMDGGFEPSYKNIVVFSASEDPSITKQVLNSLKGYNTQIIGVKDTNIWYRRVSEQGVDSGMINVNGETLKIPYAIGRKTIKPFTNVWGEDFYTVAEDNFIDVPVSGIEDPKDQKFFLSSKAMSVPTFFRTSQYSSVDASNSSNPQDSTVSYLLGSSRLNMQINLKKAISDYLFNNGVFAFFSRVSEQLGTTINPYDISREYIERNLLGRYRVDSIDVYQKTSSTTEVISTDVNPESNGFEFINTIGIQQESFFDFSIPVDSAKQIVLAFNIKRT